MTKWERLNSELADARGYAADMRERVTELQAQLNATIEGRVSLESENEALRARLEAVPDDAIRAIYDDIPVTNWTRKPLRTIREWLASVGKQVSL